MDFMVIWTFIDNHYVICVFNQSYLYTKKCCHVHRLWNAQYKLTLTSMNKCDLTCNFLQPIFTCIEFSCRLRYRVFTDMLSGTSSRFCLVQMTRLAWLEQVQREGQEEVAPTNSGPGRRSRSSSWANRKRKGEGPGRQVSVAMRMATGTWPCSLIRRYRWGDVSLVDLRENLYFSFGPAVAICSF